MCTVMVLMRPAEGRKNNNNKKIRFVARGESGFNAIGFLGKIDLLPTPPPPPKKKTSFLLRKVNQSC